MIEKAELASEATMSIDTEIAKREALLSKLDE